MTEIGAFAAFLLVFVCVVGVILALIWPAWAAQRRARRETLEMLIRKYGGTISPGLFGRPGLRFEIDGRPARLSERSRSEDSPGLTRLRVGGPAVESLRVVPENAWELLKASFGPPDLTLGDPAFDPAFMIQGPDPERIRAFLDPQRREIFLRHTLSLEAGPAGLLISTPSDLLNRRTPLEIFMRDAVALCRDWIARKDEGVRVTSLQELLVAGSCPVCAHPLGQGPRRCGSCATPHHPECWTYFGGCSTYACKENP